MQSENGTETRAQNALAQIQKELPVDIIVELVEARYERRLQVKTRWTIGTAVSASAILVSVMLAFSESPNSIETAKSVVEARLESMEAPSKSVPEQQVLVLFETLDIHLSEGQKSNVPITPGIDGEYVIVTNTSGVFEADPVLTLYRQNAAVGLEVVAFDDDGGDGYNALLEYDFNPEASYVLEVAEYYGNRTNIELYMF